MPEEQENQSTQSEPATVSDSHPASCSLSTWERFDVIKHPIFQEGYMAVHRDPILKKAFVNKVIPKEIESSYEKGSIEDQLYRAGVGACIS